jgi:hypothetical protein
MPALGQGGVCCECNMGQTESEVHRLLACAKEAVHKSGKRLGYSVVTHQPISSYEMVLEVARFNLVTDDVTMWQ